jgi:alanine racemase
MIHTVVLGEDSDISQQTAGTAVIPDGVVTWAEIDLDAIARNVTAIKAFVGAGTAVIASVKANAYGHGLRPVARIALEAGATWLAVHRIQAAIALREAGITAPILLLGHIPPSGIHLILEHNITPTLVEVETARLLSAHATRPVHVHVKIDTGMSRYGLEPDWTVDFIREVTRLPHLVIEGLFSHFASADEPNLEFAQSQWMRFQAVLRAVEDAGFSIPMPHICNSAGLVSMPAAHLAAVRPGLLIYGMAPSSESVPPFPLHRALTLKSTVTKVRHLEPGTTISYGRTFTTKHHTRTALIPLGYGDGYPRLASNRGHVLIHGQPAPIRGRICMDQCVVDITDIPGVRVGDEVVAIGRQGDAEITAEDVGTWSDTIHYEITTGLLPQVVRIYRHNGCYPAPGEGLEQWASYLRAV